MTVEVDMKKKVKRFCRKRENGYDVLRVSPDLGVKFV